MCKIYQPAGRAREYSPLALNMYKGCTHGCKYCYVPRIFCKWNRDYNHAACEPKFNATELERSAANLQGCGKQILLSFTGDPYCGIDNTPTRQALEILNRYNHHVAILTKGGTRCLKDIDLFKQFGKRIKIGATLTFSKDEESMEWEPGGALPGNRLDMLRQLHEQGITTWASFEPVVIPDHSLTLLLMVASGGYVDHVKIGKINNYQDIDKRIDWNLFIKNAVDICRHYNLPFYIKNDLASFNRDTVLRPEERDQDYLNI